MDGFIRCTLKRWLILIQCLHLVFHALHIAITDATEELPRIIWWLLLEVRHYYYLWRMQRPVLVSCTLALSRLCRLIAGILTSRSGVPDLFTLYIVSDRQAVYWTHRRDIARQYIFLDAISLVLGLFLLQNVSAHLYSWVAVARLNMWCSPLARRWLQAYNKNALFYSSHIMYHSSKFSTVSGRETHFIRPTLI